MKNSILALALLCCIHHSRAQFFNFCVNFEEPEYTAAVMIDTINYPENIWQIGPPQKPNFGNAYSLPNVIITDTINNYPVGNNSAFIIMNEVSYGYYYDLVIFEGRCFVRTDSLNDYGRIEFSPDNGITWIDLLSDTLYPSNFIWSTKPVLTGNYNGWQYFDLLLVDIGSIFPIQFGDTVLYRFTFTSDDNPDDLGGLMYDNICFYEFIEGISETRFKPVKTSIYPNPSDSFFTIDFENPKSENFELAIYTEQSERVFTRENVTGKSFSFNAANLNPGTYFYKLTNNNLKERGWGKFIVAK
jgi:hypothetical protein